ncbi:chloride channel protein [Marinilabiliaceae bacterium JC017]|nr:chloride channel protein [Marinilabiliaceae bacterium JC017]
MTNQLFQLKQLKTRRLNLPFTIKWLLISGLVGICVGTASAWFLISLKWATTWRTDHLWIVALLPLGGLMIAAMYHYWGQDVVKGNNQLLEEVENPNKIIPLKMAPLVLIGTVLTHLFGGSAGREGTAVQMGGSIADQFTKLFKFKKRDRRLLIVCGISAGFASVFGTPLAGAVFGLEVLVIGRMKYDALLPSLFSAVIANYVCELWPVAHTHYHVAVVPEFNIINLLLAVVAGIAFGLASRSFSLGIEKLSHLFKTYIKNPLFRPVVGGTIVAAFVFITGTTKYIGLGVPTIVEAFSVQQGIHVFAIKIALTVLTLSAGFKGGEVTPLFYIGATLGSALSLFLPLPMGILAAMGFVAVFAGAANTPVACVLMGLELFGTETGVFIMIGCFVAYLFSGHSGIYTSQKIGSPKNPILLRDKSKHLNSINK